MMFEIFDGEKLVNTVVANESFIKTYCVKKGYTYKVVKETASDQQIPTLEERTAALEAAMLSMMGVSIDV